LGIPKSVSVHPLQNTYQLVVYDELDYSCIIIIIILSGFYFLIFDYLDIINPSTKTEKEIVKLSTIPTVPVDSFREIANNRFSVSRWQWCCGKFGYDDYVDIMSAISRSWILQYKFTPSITGSATVRWLLNAEKQIQIDQETFSHKEEVESKFAAMKDFEYYLVDTLERLPREV